MIVYHLSKLRIDNTFRADYRIAVETLLSTISNDPVDDTKVCVIVGHVFNKSRVVNAADIADFLLLLNGLLRVCTHVVTLSTTADVCDGSDLVAAFVTDPRHTHLSSIGSDNACVEVGPPDFNRMRYITLKVTSFSPSEPCVLMDDVHAFCGGHVDYAVRAGARSYPGAMTQKGADESFAKGFLRWTLDGKPTTTFIQLRGPRGFIRITLPEDDTAPPQFNSQGATDIPEDPYQVDIVAPFEGGGGAAPPNLQSIVETARRKYRLEPRIIQKPKWDIPPKYAMLSNAIVRMLDAAALAVAPALTWDKECVFYSTDAPDVGRHSIELSGAIVVHSPVGKPSIIRALAAMQDPHVQKIKHYARLRAQLLQWMARNKIAPLKDMDAFHALHTAAKKDASLWTSAHLKVHTKLAILRGVLETYYRHRNAATAAVAAMSEVVVPAAQQHPTARERLLRSIIMRHRRRQSGIPSSKQLFVIEDLELLTAADVAAVLKMLKPHYMCVIAFTSSAKQMTRAFASCYRAEYGGQVHTESKNSSGAPPQCKEADGAQPFSCKACDYSTSSKTRYERHLKSKRHLLKAG